MDPFSLATGITGLVSLAATAISAANNYLSGVKNAKTSIATLITELKALQSNLSSLDEFLRHSSSTGLAFHQTSVLRSCTLACENKLQSLVQKLGQNGESRRHRYLWPLSEKEHQKTIGELRAFSRWLQFSLSVDGCSLLSRTSEDVLKILGQQLEDFKVLNSIEKRVVDLQESVADQTRMLLDDRDSKTREHILNWISKHDPNQKHYSIRPARIGGTGTWFLERLKYLQWGDGESVPNVLWSYGIQGSGKTVLTSILVDELKGSSILIRRPFAFFYFDYQDQDHQTPIFVISSILRQILESMPEIPKRVVDAWNERGSGGHFSLDELQEIVLDIAVNTRERIYLVIDALDECAERHRKAFLQFVDRLKQAQTISFLITSRPYPHDIYSAFQDYPQIEIQAQDADLRNYIYQELEQAGVRDVVDDEFTAEIVQKLASSAQGMFLLPIIQLRNILKEPTAGDMEDALSSLSCNLSEAFEETIARIQRLPQNRSRLGINTLMWICHAKRALTAIELSDVLSVRPGQSEMRPKHRPSPKMILDCCQGLAAIEPESGIIRLAHYSIQEYLSGQSENLFPFAAEKMATTCLTYLAFDIFRAGPCSGDSSFDPDSLLGSNSLLDSLFSRIESSPFLPYASDYWGAHVRTSEGDETVQQLTSVVLECHSAASAWQIQRFVKDYREEYYDPQECYSMTPVHVVSALGLRQTLLKMLDQSRYSIDARSKMGSTPLILAASRNHASIVKILLERGAKLYLENWYGNALHCAAEAGYSSTISELVRHGMSLDPSQYHSGRLPIYCTLDRDKAAAFGTLINLGADINAREETRESIFHEAVMNNCTEIVDLILRRCWVDIDSKFTLGGCTAVHFAAEKRSTIMLSKLIGAGADINAEDGEGRTPVNLARDCDNKDAVGLLLEHGAF